jgi:aspartyl-tRNA(Asn)/glutamyl-tRNA(Gln) amidotransferase subunit A
MTDAELVVLDCTALAAAIRLGRVTSERVTEALLARAEAVQPVLNAFVRIDAEQALSAARAADRDLAAGRVRGPLHGVPMAHKDMFYRRGVPSGCGSRITVDHPATTTATALERLDAAGALQFGVLNMAEFAFGPTGHNWHLGHCRNAWSPEHVTGGSSSGSGTAVAARATPAALGSDTGGSIRMPASFCGVAGIKPTYGLVSRAGAMPLSFSMDTIGPLARTVEDCALLLRTIAGADPRDPTCDPRPVPDYVALLERPVRGLVIGRPRSYFYDACDPEIIAAMEDSLDRLRELGATVVDLDLPDVDAWNAAGTMVISAEAAAVHGPWLRSRPHDYSAQVLARLRGGLAVPATAYIDSLRLRGRAIAEFGAAVFSKVDVLHSPTIELATPTIAQTDVGGGPGMAALLARVTRLTRPANFLGLPALSVPAGFSRAGLPIGMQLTGRPFDEATLLTLGHAYQRATGLHERAPAL